MNNTDCPIHISGYNHLSHTFKILWYLAKPGYNFWIKEIPVGVKHLGKTLLRHATTR